MSSGYYRFPTLHADTVVFVSEDDLWTVPRQGGLARRLTSNLGEVNYPAFSPDGQWLAFVGREEGMAEVYLMPAEGGSARRMTYLNSRCQVLGWSPDSRFILFASTHNQFDPSNFCIFQIDSAALNGAVVQAPVGPARSIAYGPAGQVVIGRNTGDPARWKRYRGGTAGHLWIDRRGDGQFERFLGDVAGNIASPMWVTLPAGPRVFFVSDHEGVGNLYSCQADGADLRRHTDHEDFYVRNPSTDGQRIVYHAGADLFVFDPGAERSDRVEVDYRSPRVQRNRKFVPAYAYLDNARLHPSGTAMAITTRGKPFVFFNHEGPVIQLGQRDRVRYRLPDWLNDDEHLVMVDDGAGEEELVIHGEEPTEEPRRLPGLDLGRPVQLKVSPTEDKAAITNHRNELLVVDLTTGSLTVIDRSPWRAIAGFDWSPDGRWLAYGFATSLSATEIRLYHLEEAPAGGQDRPQPAGDEAAEAAAGAGRASTPNPIAITHPVLYDVAPAFDPDGKYLYFLSYREFNPVYDNLHFDLGFPWGMRPYLITLRADLPNPFVPQPDFGDGADHDHDDDEEQDEDDEEDGAEGAADSGEEGEPTGEDGDEEGGEDSDGGEDDDDGDGPGSEEWPLRQLNSVRPHRDAGAPEDAGAEAIAGLSEVLGAATGAEHAEKDKKDEAGAAKKQGRKPLVIDLDGIERRIVAFPVPDSRYGQIAGAPGRALFTSFGVEGALDGDFDWEDLDEENQGTLRAWVFKEYKAEVVAENVASFELSRNRKKLIYFSSKRVRVIAAGEKAPGDSGPGRKSGWIDLGRVKVSVDPQGEWEQMYREAWRLQRDHYWTEDMADVDWNAVFDRYFPLIERVSTRSEFSDLVWEMQGELGTSHAYEIGGDYRPAPYFNQGMLAATFDWDATAPGYRVRDIVAGDAWDSQASSPLLAPGVDIRPGDVLLAINGQRLDAVTGPAQLLVNQAGNEVLLSLALRPEEAAKAETAKAETAKAETAKAETVPEKAAGPRYQTRAIVVRALRSEVKTRYRAWVDENRRRVHAASGGRIGYLHIPDMGPRGYAEFHRGYLAEVARDGLIVDVRYNGGGNVSQLLLEKLARRRIGYDQSRWGGISPYPAESVAGPVVAITNELAGSDGDIFCHSFKLLKLGPLIGTRTWGGVIGIWPRHPLVDGTVTTQPEYSFWFEDVGWNVENYGTDPDIVVENTPQDHVSGRDAQLDRALEEALVLLEAKPISRPDVATRPSRALPKLPRRA